MNIGSSIRRSGFWMLDRLRGGDIRRHYDDVHWRMEGVGPSSDQLGRLLDHAVQTTRMYADFGGKDLHAFPVVGKADYKQRMDQFLSSSYAGKKLHTATTSGSTGTPVTIAQDDGKRRRSIADTIVFNEMAGLRLGDRLMWIHNWIDEDERSWLQRTMQNIVEVKILGMDTRSMRDIVRTLGTGRIDAVLCYGSKLEDLARFMESDGADPFRFGLRGVISDSESLSPLAKRRIETAFGAPVSDRYANLENGMLATTKPGDDRFHLNRSSFVFECLKLHADESETPGEVARLVVTDLYDFATPMIRYDTGDLVRVADEGIDGPLTLRSLEGRRADIVYGTDGRELSATTITFLLEEYVDLVRYQFVQEGASDYRLSVVLGDATYEPNDFTAQLLPHLGEGARLSVGFVDRIEAPPGRKFRPVVRNYEPRAESGRSP